MQIPEQRVLPAAEGVPRHRHGDRHVHADHPHRDLALERARGRTVLGEDRGAVAVRVRVDDLDGLLEGVHPQHHEHRTEDLLLVSGHLVADLVDDRGSHEEAILVAGDHEIAPVQDESRAVLLRLGDDACDALLGLRGDDRAHVRALLHAVAHSDALAQGLDPCDHLVSGVADRHGHGDGHAALAGGAERGRVEVLRGAVHVCVGHDDRVVLGTAQGLHALAVLRTCFVDVLGDRGGAHE